MIALNRQGGFYKLLNVVGLVFDPELDANRLPVVKATASAPPRTRTVKPKNVRTMCDGKDYAYEEDIDERTGMGTITLDSTRVRTHTKRTDKITQTDRDVFNAFKADDKYAYFDMAHYELIKRIAWSLGMGYRKAYKLTAIKNLEGCGERRLADYYKAINQANRMSQ